MSKEADRYSQQAENVTQPRLSDTHKPIPSDTANRQRTSLSPGCPTHTNPSRQIQPTGRERHSAPAVRHTQTHPVSETGQNNITAILTTSHEAVQHCRPKHHPHSRSLYMAHLQHEVSLCSRATAILFI